MRISPFKQASRALATSLVASLFVTLCPAQENASPEPATSIIALGANGSLAFSVDGKSLGNFVPTAADTQWRFSEGIKTGRSPMKNPQFRLTASGPIQGEAALTPKTDVADATWIFSSTEAVSFNTLAVATKLSLDDFIGGTWKTDLAEGPFPERFEKEAIYGGNVSRLTVTAVDGRSFTLSFPTPTHVGLQDDRRWGGRSFTIRIGQVFGKLAAGESYHLTLTVQLPGKTTYRNDEEVVILPGRNWVPLVPFLDIVPGSALDLSSIQSTDGACGSKGRLIATPDGHFAFANEPTIPRRFYGANLCFSSQYQSKENVDKLLDRWIRMGYNTLRIHHYEFSLTTPIWKTGFDWDPRRLDQLCYLIAGCSKRGIWLTTDLYVSRPISPAQIGVPSEKPYITENGLVDVQLYKALILVHEPAFQDFKKFTMQLLNHVNPYTGKRLADEPAIAWLSLINEGAPGDRVKTLPEWKKPWNVWLAKRYPTRSDLAAALGDLKAEEDTKSGSVEFPESGVLTDTPRGQVCQVFLAETEKNFIDRTRAFLRDELKCPALLTNHNCPPNTVPDLGLRENFDYVDDHFYIDHPIFEKGWGLPSRSPNESPVRDGAPRATSSATIRLWGKPLTVSEFNFSGPGRFRGVGALMTAALASIQDWDVLWRFAYAHSDKEIFTPSPIDYFNIVRDPLSLAADRAAVMLFLRGDLKTPSSRVAYTLTPGDLADATATSKTYIPAGLAWTTRFGVSVKTLPPQAISIPYSSTKETVLAKLAAAGIQADGPVVRSETGELTLDKTRGVLTVDTALTAGGYADEGQTIQTRQSGVSVKDVVTGSTLFVTSLDGKPMRDSSRLLVTHLTDLQNSGAHYGESARQTLLSWGGLPYLVRDGRATVSIPLAKPNAYQVWELSVAGHRLERVPASVENGQLVFTATVRGNHGARMLYEITTEAAQPDPIVETIKASLEATKNALKLSNGDMTHGTETPTDWALKFDVGTLKMVRDTSSFVSAPASLRLESVGGKAKGLASQRINLADGETVKITAKVKTEGSVGHAALVMLAIGGSPNWNEVATFKNATDWQTVSADFTAPPGTQFCLLLLFMDGEGKVWLDDASIQRPQDEM